MIDVALLFAQVLNGAQFGFMLFLIAAGLTLTFGVMNFLNLAHGALYMLGAFFAATIYEASGNFIIAVVGAAVSCLIVGLALERGLLRPFYDKDHLDQVLVTFGLVLIANEGVRVVWGPIPLQMPMPEVFDDVAQLPFGIVLPFYRIFVLVVGALAAIALYCWIIPEPGSACFRAPLQVIGTPWPRSGAMSPVSTALCLLRVPHWLGWRARWSLR